MYSPRSMDDVVANKRRVVGKDGYPGITCARKRSTLLAERGRLRAADARRTRNLSFVTSFTVSIGKLKRAMP